MSATDVRKHHEWFGSITVRLAVFYFVGTLVILLSVSIALYWVLLRNLERDEIAALARDVAELETLLQNPEANQTLIAMVVNPPQWGSNAAMTPMTYRRIRSANEDLLFETSGMRSRLPDDVFPEPTPVDAVRGARRWVTPEGSPYLLVSTFGPLAAGGAPTVIQAAMDVSNDEQLMVDYRRSMAALLLLGTLLSSGIAITVARHGIRPLKDIAMVIRRVGLDRLDERVHPARWPHELRDLASAFDHMLKRLETSVQHLRWFSADVAHELRTPVNVLMGEAEVALSKQRTEQEYREVLQSTLEESHRLARLIDNLLFLARAENAQTTLERTSIGSREELAAIGSFFEPAANELGIALSITGEVRVSADATLFRRAVSNLVSNALQHTPRGGQIAVAAKRVIGASEIVVADTGSGIEPEHKDRIFDRFYRGTTSANRHFSAGIGLAIVKSIMTLHGGSVEIESKPGMGTTARLTFPDSG